MATECKAKGGERDMAEDGGSNAHMGIASFRRGVIADSSIMPFKAFGVASLFVGAAASSAIASLKASGIHKVEDVMEVGANFRNGLGICRRTRDE